MPLVLAGGSTWVQGQPGLHNEFQDNPGYIEKPRLRKNKTKTKNKNKITFSPEEQFCGQKTETNVMLESWHDLTPATRMAVTGFNSHSF